jgi:hypothetical protein
MTDLEPDAIEELAFDAALAELERTVAELGAGGLPLERTLALTWRRPPGAVRAALGDAGCGCAASSRSARGALRRRAPGRRRGLIALVRAASRGGPG